MLPESHLEGERVAFSTGEWPPLLHRALQNCKLHLVAAGEFYEAQRAVLREK